MSSSLPADILAEMKGQDRVYSVFEIDLSTTLRFGDKGAVASDSLGTYAPYLVDGSLPSRTINLVEGSLEIGRGSVTIQDIDRVLQKESGGPFAVDVYSVPARWKLVSPAAQPFTIFEGVITNFNMGDQEGVYEYEIAPNILEFDSAIKFPILSKDLFPSIPDDYRDEDVPMYWGQYTSSSGTGGAGMIPLIPMGEGTLFLISLGQIESVDSVWVNGTKRPASDLSFTHLQRGNHRFSIVNVTGSPAVTVTDTVTADIHGVTDSPGGISGTMISNPVTMLRTILAKFVYGDGITAPIGTTWPSETGLPLATSVLDAAETFCAVRNIEASLDIFSSDTPRAIVNKIAKDWPVKPFFTLDQKFALTAEDNAATDIYADEDHHIIEHNRDVLRFGGVETQRGDIITKLKTSIVLNRAGTSYAQTHDVADLSKTFQVTKSFEMETSVASEF